MSGFENEDLTEAEFRECDLTRARLIGVVMQDAVIDGLVSNLVVNGVEVSSYVEAQLDRRHPVRLLLGSTEPACVKATGSSERIGMRRSSGSGKCRRVQSTIAWWRVVGDGDDAPPGVRARLVVPPVLLPGIGPPVHGDRLSERLHAGLGRQGLDPAAAPGLDEVLAVREEQAADLQRWLATVRADELSALAPVPDGPGWPAYARGRSVLGCLHVVLDEE